MTFLGTTSWPPRRDAVITPMGRFFQITSFVLARLVSEVTVLSRDMRRVLRLDRGDHPCGIDLEFFHPMDRAEACRLTDWIQARSTSCLRTTRKSNGSAMIWWKPPSPKRKNNFLNLKSCCAQETSLRNTVVHERADVVVIASMLEGGPLCTKEAMATNLPSSR